jgi:hypothetical protein
VKKKKPSKSTNPAEELRKEKLEALQKDFVELESYKKSKLTLQCPTFFVPGWTGEDCAAWKTLPLDEKLPVFWRFKEFYHPAKRWIESIVSNSGDAHYVTFTDEESRRSKSFKDLGGILKDKIVSIAEGYPVNLVGHSMGGLDIRAAVLNDEKPVLNVKNLITVGTPNNGTTEAGLMELRTIRELAGKFGKAAHHIEQCRNMGSNSLLIKEINTPQNLRKLLDRLETFYVLMGLRDMVVRKSPMLKKDRVPEDIYKEKVKLYQATSDEHSGKDSITQDPRMVLRIIRICCGNPVVEDWNRGYIFKKA